VLKRLPLNSLRAFEAVARKRSFSRAADELHVTHAAVSHQIKALEEYIGVPVLKRGRVIELTDAGRRLFPILSESLDKVSDAINGIRAPKTGYVLNVSLTGTFASKWLIPRLAKFLSDHPDIDVRLRSSYRFVDFSRESYDAAIRCGHGDWPDLFTTFLMPVDFIPVCSLAYIKKVSQTGMLKLNDLRHCRLLHADIGQHRVGEEWSTWLGAAGLSFEPDRGISFYDPSLAMQAAIEGLGIAIGYDTLVADDLASGRLVAPFDFKVRAALSYYFVCPKKNAELAKIACFRDWISAEARSSCLGRGVESPS
jgi:LysR family glycine cleavage system transcriptional activator